MGQCSRFMGNCTKASFYYKQFLLKRPESKQKEAILKLIAECGKESKQAPPPGKNPPAGTTPGQAEQPGAADPASPGKVDGDAPPAAAPTGGEAEPASREGQGKVSRIWFWSGVGLTTALLATAAGTGIAARLMNDEYHDPSISVDRGLELRDQGRNLETACWATLGIGAAAAAGTAVLFWLSRSQERPDDSGNSPATKAALSIAATPLKGGGGFLLGGSF